MVLPCLRRLKIDQALLLISIYSTVDNYSFFVVVVVPFLFIRMVTLLQVASGENFSPNTVRFTVCRAVDIVADRKMVV